ncbi:hypothetical protein EJ02DRAFT_404015 [Clathrospora elynae]|uniref:J domain-containing protein n=1 Tax=Clathrospora elynae TaxID=706981 RepID=A0A6A5SPL5_9PLEO|nr:hypothetical protein EJ02DRAFT_404015 [Clathrospora elynae]
MLSFVNEYFLKLAAATPLPSDEVRAAGNDATVTPRPHIPSHAFAFVVTPAAQNQSCPPSPNAVPKPTNKKRKHKPKITIFFDADAANEPLKTPKRSKTNSPRTPLADRTHSSNSTPAPSPHLPDTPFPLSSADPWWENIENYDMNNIISPPATPHNRPLRPSPSVGPPPPLTTRTLRPRARQTAVPNTLLPPAQNMILYNMLGLRDWSVSADAIKFAYRRVAFTSHPDRASIKDREIATLEMQQINAAKDLLLDARRRRQYHADGIVPWVV